MTVVPIILGKVSKNLAKTKQKIPQKTNKLESYSDKIIITTRKVLTPTKKDIALRNFRNDMPSALYRKRRKIWLVPLFNYIWTFFGYLMPKISFLENNGGTIFPIFKIIGVYTYPKGIIPKENIIAQLKFELTYYDVAVPHVNHYATKKFVKCKKKRSINRVKKKPVKKKKKKNKNNNNTTNNNNNNNNNINNDNRSNDDYMRHDESPWKTIHFSCISWEKKNEEKL